MSKTVLITGTFGLAGVPTVAQFAADAWRVVATAHRTTGGSLPAGVMIRHIDLSNPFQVRRLVSEVTPSVIVHLAAVIPPQAYRDAKVTRRANVDATAALVRAAEAQPHPPRFVHASSASVYGARNPHRVKDLLTPDTPVRPCELYGGHKLEAEQIVRSSHLDWVVMRLGGIYSVDPAAMSSSRDSLYFGAALPIDARLHTVDARDVAAAFVAAATADVVGEILLIGGDDSHLVRVGALMQTYAAAQGFRRYPMGKLGNPDSDTDWPAVGDWMDVARAQEALGFQHHSWPDMLAEVRAITGWKYYSTRLIAPLARAVLKRRSPYRKAPGQYADVWGAVRSGLGEPSLETPPNPGK